MRVNRRACLAVIGGGLTTSLAGCSSLPLIGSDGPDDVVEAFIGAIQDGDREAANDLIHPDSPQGEFSEEEWEEAQGFDTIEVEILEVEENDDEATVTSEMTVGWDGETMTDETEWVLRTHDGEWKIWE